MPGSIDVLFDVSLGKNTSNKAITEINKVIDDIQKGIKDEPIELKIDIAKSSVNKLYGTIDQIKESINQIGKSGKSGGIDVKGLASSITEIGKAATAVMNALPKEGSALSRMSQEGSAGIDTMVSKLEELSAILDKINNKPFTSQSVFNIGGEDTGATKLDLARKRALAMLNVVEQMNKAYGEMNKIRPGDNVNIFSRAVAGTGLSGEWLNLMSGWDSRDIGNKIFGAKSIHTVNGQIARMMDFIDLYNQIYKNANDRTGFVADIDTSGLDAATRAFNEYEESAHNASKSANDAAAAQARAMLGISDSTASGGNANITLDSVDIESVRGQLESIIPTLDTIKAKLAEAFDLSEVANNIGNIKAQFDALVNGAGAGDNTATPVSSHGGDRSTVAAQASSSTPSMRLASTVKTTVIDADNVIRTMSNAKTYVDNFGKSVVKTEVEIGNAAGVTAERVTTSYEEQRKAAEKYGKDLDKHYDAEARRERLIADTNNFISKQKKYLEDTAGLTGADGFKREIKSAIEGAESLQTGLQEGIIDDAQLGRASTLLSTYAKNASTAAISVNELVKAQREANKEQEKDNAKTERDQKKADAKAERERKREESDTVEMSLRVPKFRGDLERQGERIESLMKSIADTPELSDQYAVLQSAMSDINDMMKIVTDGSFGVDSNGNDIPLTVDALKGLSTTYGEIKARADAAADAITKFNQARKDEAKEALAYEKAEAKVAKDAERDQKRADAKAERDSNKSSKLDRDINNQIDGIDKAIASAESLGGTSGDLLAKQFRDAREEYVGLLNEMYSTEGGRLSVDEIAKAYDSVTESVRQYKQELIDLQAEESNSADATNRREEIALKFDELSQRYREDAIKYAGVDNEEAKNKVSEFNMMAQAMQSAAENMRKGVTGEDAFGAVEQNIKAWNAELSLAEKNLKLVLAAQKELDKEQKESDSDAEKVSNRAPKFRSDLTNQGGRVSQLLESISGVSELADQYDVLQGAMQDINRIMQIVTDGSFGIDSNGNNIPLTSDGLEGLITTLGEIETRVSAASKAIEQFSKAQKDAEKEALAREKAEAKVAEEAEKRQKDADNATTPAKRAQAIREVASALREVDKLQKQYNDTQKRGTDEVKKSYDSLQGYKDDLLGIASALLNPDILQEDFIKNAEKLKEILLDIAKAEFQLEQGGTSKGEDLFSFSSMFSRLTPYRVFTGAIRTFKQMVTESIAMNDAMTQLQVVTKSSNETMADYGKTAFSSAKQLGVSAKDVVDATTTYARLGYTLEDSNTMAKLTTMLQNVGGIDAGDAQNAITAVVKAYNIGTDQLESVMDKMVAVGNGAPISVSQIAAGMNNAASILAASGNSFDESLALLTAANTTVQDASKASTGLRTIAARIRNVKSELDDLGEDTNTTAKYEEIVSALTNITTVSGEKRSVSLTDDNGNLKSTYQIVKDIAEVWDDMDSKAQAGLAEKLAGNRQQAIFYDLIKNFKDIDSTMSLMNESAGELSDSYDIYMASTTAHINQFKAAYSELSSDVADSGIVKAFVDMGTSAVEAIDGIFASAKKTGLLGGATAAGGTLAAFGALTGIMHTLRTESSGIHLSGLQDWLSLGNSFGALKGGAVAGIKSLFSTIFSPAGVALLTAAGTAFLAYRSSLEYAVNATKEARAEVVSTENEIASANKEIASNQKRIDEIRSDSSKTWRDDAEADNLENQNRLLEAQVAVRERALDSQKRLAAQSAMSAVSKMVADDVETVEIKDAEGNVINTYENSTRSLLDYVIKYKKAYDDTKAARDRIAKEISDAKDSGASSDLIAGLTTQYITENDKLTDIAKRLEPYESDVLEMYKALTSYTGGDIEGLEGVIEKIESIYPELNPDKYVKSAFENSALGDAGRSAWFDKLDSSEKKIVFDLVLNSGGAEKSIEDLQAEFEQTKQIIAAIENANTWDSFKTKVDGAITAQKNLTAAFAAGNSATGMTTEQIQSVIDAFDKLDNFDPAVLFERTANGVKMNAKAFSEYNKELNATKEIEIYQKLIEKQKKLTDLRTDRDAANKAANEARAKEIEKEIVLYETLIAEYEGANSKLNAYIQSTSTADYSDNLTTIGAGYKNVEKLINSGRVGNDSVTSYLDLMLGDNWRSDFGDATKAFQQLSRNIAGTSNSLRTYMATDGNGNFNVNGLKAFVEDLVTLNKNGSFRVENTNGRGDMIFKDIATKEWSSETNSWNYSLDLTGDRLAVVAKQLGTTEEFIQNIGRALQETGWDVHFDTAAESIKNVEKKIKELEDRRKELESELKGTTSEWRQKQLKDQIADIDKQLNAEGKKELAAKVRLAIEGDENGQGKHSVKELLGMDDAELKETLDIDDSEIDVVKEKLMSLATLGVDIPVRIQIDEDQLQQILEAINPELKIKPEVEKPEIPDSVTETTAVVSEAPEVPDPTPITVPLEVDTDGIDGVDGVSFEPGFVDKLTGWLNKIFGVGDGVSGAEEVPVNYTVNDVENPELELDGEINWKVGDVDYPSLVKFGKIFWTSIVDGKPTGSGVNGLSNDSPPGGDDGNGFYIRYAGTMTSVAMADGTAYNVLNLQRMSPSHAGGNVALRDDEYALTNEVG